MQVRLLIARARSTPVVLALLIGTLALAPLRAQTAGGDTVEKFIYGVPGRAKIQFMDPDGRPNAVDISVDDPSGLLPSSTHLDVTRGSFEVTARKYGDFLVSVRYRQSDGLPNADSGASYVRVHVRPMYLSPLRTITGPDISGTVDVPVCALPGVPPLDTARLAFSPHALYQYHVLNAGTADEQSYWDVVWRTPPGRSISLVTADPSSCAASIVLDNGMVLSTAQDAKLDQFTVPRIEDAVPLQPGEYVTSLVNGSHAVVSTGTLYRKDGSGGWSEETLAPSQNRVLGIVSLNSILFAATPLGVFSKTPGGNWTKLDQSPFFLLTSIGVGADNKLYVAGDGIAAVSDDGGSHWAIDTFGTGPAARIGADSHGNTFVVTRSLSGPNEVYRKKAPTPLWGKMLEYLVEKWKAEDFVPLFKNVATSSDVAVATLEGVMRSTDGGDTWKPVNDGLWTPNIFALIKSPTETFISTNQGLFKGSFDGTWQDVSLPGSRRVGEPLYSDSSFNLYALGPQRLVDFNSLPPINWRSTDGGLTWRADTTGLWRVLHLGAYYVAPGGTQFWATRPNSFGSYPAELFMKSSGADWTKDETFPGTMDSYPLGFATQADGSFYIVMSIEGTRADILRRTPQGTWMHDTVGLGATVVYGLATGADGNLYAATESRGVLRYDGTAWVPTSEPPGRARGEEAGLHAAASSGASAIGVDARGAVYAAFFSQTDPAHIDRLGIFRSGDAGRRWEPLGFEGINVAQIVTFGDSAYALTDEGLYRLPGEPDVTAVPIDRHRTRSLAAAVDVAPNPVRGDATMRLTLSEPQHVEATLTDAAGAVVSRIVDATFDAGEHAIEVPTATLASGVYFCRVELPGGAITRRVVVVR